MKLSDIVILCINLFITAVSLIAAFRSWKYYKKSKTLSEHTQLNKAFVEIGKIQNKLPEALSATNKSRKIKQGYNLLVAICKIGNEIHTYYNEMNSCIPAGIVEEFQELQNQDNFDIQKYINGYISGDAIQDNILNPEDYATCQKRLMEMQNYLKKKIDESGEKLK